MEYVIIFIVAVIIRTIILWIAMGMTKVKGGIIHLFLAAGAASLISLIPLFLISQILSVIVLIWLISLWTDAEPWPDVVLIVVISWAISYLVFIYILGLLEHIATS